MRILVCFLSFLGTTGFAQNWQAINRANSYTYFTGQAFSSVTIIKTDSAATQGSDSVFYLNLIVKPLAGDSTKKLVRQGQFLGKKILQRSNGQTTFTGDQNFTVNVLAGPGNAWVFDSVKGYTATVTLVKYDTIFGLSDSMKVITVSNGDTIILSKHYGILSFKDAASSLRYSLKGIQNLNLGYHVAGFADIFNFNVGDVFEYQKFFIYSTHSISSSYRDIYHWKLKITSKTRIGGSVQYIANRIELDTTGLSFVYPYKIVHFSIQDTLIYSDSSSNFLNGYNYQRIRIPKNESLYSPVTYDKELYFGYSSLFQTDLKFHIEQQFSPYNGDTVFADSHYFPYYDETTINRGRYGNGIGLEQYYSYAYAGNGGNVEETNIRLMGCKKGGIIYGQLTPDSVLLAASINESGSSRTYSVYPSLIRDNTPVHIEGKGKPCSARIYSSDGRLILSVKLFTSGQTSADISTAELSHGIYIIQLQDDSACFSAKLMKE